MTDGGQTLETSVRYYDEPKTSARYYADNEYVPATIAAKIAHLSVSAMNKLRWNGEGPAYFKIGKSVRYRVGDVRVWLESKRVTSTADQHEGAAA